MTDITPPTLRPNILANVDRIVKEEMDKGVIPLDHKWAIVAVADKHGTKLLAAVNLKSIDSKVKVQVQAIWEHDWDGNDSAAGKVVFSGK